MLTEDEFITGAEAIHEMKRSLQPISILRFMSLSVRVPLDIFWIYSLAFCHFLLTSRKFFSAFGSQASRHIIET
jgi:hypothetical protein